MKGNVYLSSGFSLKMLLYDINPNTIQIQPIDRDEVEKGIKDGFISAIRHPDFANILSDRLNTKIKVDKTDIILTPDDVLYVAQLYGGRLPEDAYYLPFGYKIRYYKITLTTEN